MDTALIEVLRSLINIKPDDSEEKKNINNFTNELRALLLKQLSANFDLTNIKTLHQLELEKGEQEIEKLEVLFRMNESKEQQVDKSSDEKLGKLMKILCGDSRDGDVGVTTTTTTCCKPSSSSSIKENHDSSDSCCDQLLCECEDEALDYLIEENRQLHEKFDDQQEKEVEIVSRVSENQDASRRPRDVDYLKKQKDSVNLRRIGYISGINIGLSGLDIRAVSDATIAYAVAQAILDNIACSEHGLTVRDILPDLDLLDGHGNPISQRKWIQKNPNPEGHSSPSNVQKIYTTGRKSDNDRKVIAIWGFENLDISAVNSIIVKRSDVRVIDVLDTSALQYAEDEKDRIAVLKTPILFKRMDNMSIEFIFDEYVDTTQIRLRGCVVEALGSHMCG